MTDIMTKKVDELLVKVDDKVKKMYKIMDKKLSYMTKDFDNKFQSYTTMLEQSKHRMI